MTPISFSVSIETQPSALGSCFESLSANSKTRRMMWANSSCRARSFIDFPLKRPIMDDGAQNIKVFNDIKAAQ